MLETVDAIITTIRSAS